MELSYEETMQRIAEREKDDLNKCIDSFKNSDLDPEIINYNSNT